MIVVTVRLHSAITGNVTTLGQMVIANDGTSADVRRGNYDVRLGRKNQPLREVYDKPQRSARVENHLRLSKSVWNLVAKSLRNLGFLSP